MEVTEIFLGEWRRGGWRWRLFIDLSAKKEFISRHRPPSPSPPSGKEGGKIISPTSFDDGISSLFPPLTLPPHLSPFMTPCEGGKYKRSPSSSSRRGWLKGRRKLYCFRSRRRRRRRRRNPLFLRSRTFDSWDRGKIGFDPCNQGRSLTPLCVLKSLISLLKLF